MEGTPLYNKGIKGVLFIMCVVIKELSRKPRKEIERIKSELNLTDEEEIVFGMSMRNKSAQEIADKLNVSLRTAFRRIRDVEYKIKEFYFYDDEYEPWWAK